MESHTAIERHELSIGVVQDFHLRARLGQQDGEAAGKRFHVAGVFRYQRQDPFQKARFSAWPTQRWPHFERRQVLIICFSVAGKGS